MAYSKIVLNGETLMDVTSDTVAADKMLDGTVGTKNDGTKATGNIASTTHPNPTATIASSTGVITASHTQGTGYVSGGTTTSTTNLTTQAAQTINTSTVDQTIASYRWLTGTQTIKSVVTSNLTAANIAEGVVVKVGDANNASRITQITGTHSGATSYTATISGSGNTSYCYVTYSGTKYYTNGNTFSFKAGDTLTIYSRGNNVSINGDSVTLSNYSYTYTLPVGDITINLSYSSYTNNSIAIYGLIQPTGTLSISAAGNHNVYKYSVASVSAGSAFPPAVTITKAPTIGVNTSGVVTASYNGSSSITPTVNAGYITTGTAGTISTTGTSTYQLTSQAAATYYPSTADQTIASQRWLVGNQTIKSVVTSNLTAANIVSGVTVKVGDSGNASRIAQVVGIYSGIIPTGTSEITSNGTYNVYGYASASVNVAGGEYYDVYKHLTYRSSINSTVSSIMQSFFNTLDTIPSYMFEDVKVVGNYSFPICSYLGDGAFCHSLLDGESCSFDFPELLGVGKRAFLNQNKMLSINCPKATSIGTSAFNSCGLTTVSFPSCTTINQYAFYACKSLTTASFSVCTSIGNYAFYGCSALTTTSFPSCTTINQYAFHGCGALTTASFPVCTIVSSWAFRSCKFLTTANFPSCTSIDISAFYDCSSLTTISFPVCTIVSSCAFQNCIALTTANFPSCTSVGTSAFYKCQSLTTISLPICSSFGTYAFQNCYNLLSFYLNSVSAVPNFATNMFYSTPISTYTTSTGGVRGKIYVPSSLYDTFKTATGWTAYSSLMVSM